MLTKCLTLYQACFLNFWKVGRRGSLACIRKIVIKPVCFTQVTWNLVQLMFGFKKITLITWSKWWRQHYFDDIIIQQQLLRLSFKFEVTLKHGEIINSICLHSKPSPLNILNFCSFVGFVGKKLYRIKISRWPKCLALAVSDIESKKKLLSAIKIMI